MKKFFLWFVAAAFMLAACSDDSSTESITNKASSIRSSCKFDDSWFEEANAAKSLKKMVYSEPADEREPERYFYVEDLGDSVLVSLTGLVDACNKLVRDIEVRVGGDTLHATLHYEPGVGSNCICSWVDMSFTVDKGLLDDPVKTLVIGEEVFARQEKTEMVEESSEE